MDLFEMLQSCDRGTMALFIYALLDQKEKDLAKSLSDSFGINVDIVSLTPELRIAQIMSYLKSEVGGDFE